MTETIDLKNGYKAVVEQDLMAGHPWKEFDGQPPILVYNLDPRRGRLEDYGTGLSLFTALWEIPVRLFGPKHRPEILQACGIEAEDCHRYLDHPRKAKAEDWKNAIAETITRNPDAPQGWTSARTFFEGLEFLCNLAKIPCRWCQSNGYCQGDSAWVFVAAVPAWQKEVGWTVKTPEDKLASLQGDLDLWTSWAWGDVYGFSSLIRPDGSALDASCWGFYGRDHAESGLVEHAEDAAEADARWLVAEAARVRDAACRDIVTVPLLPAYDGLWPWLRYAATL